MFLQVYGIYSTVQYFILHYVLSLCLVFLFFLNNCVYFTVVLKCVVGGKKSHELTIIFIAAVKTRQLGFSHISLVNKLKHLMNI